MHPDASSYATAGPIPLRLTRAAAARLGSKVVLELHRLICCGLQPDLTVLLLPSLKTSLARARRRNDNTTQKNGPDENRFEREKDAFYGRVWQKYRDIAARDAHRVIAIEGDLSIDEVHEQIVEAVSMRLTKSVRSS